jgi:hypothetical protein
VVDATAALMPFSKKRKFAGEGDPPFNTLRCSGLSEKHEATHLLRANDLG